MSTFRQMDRQVAVLVWQSEPEAQSMSWLQ
jgi:hypothetical protein